MDQVSDWDEDIALHLDRGKPILGDFEDAQRGRWADWMKHLDDRKPITKVNIPGAHDAATGGYTKAVRERFLKYTGPIPPSEIFQCQDRSLFQMLGDGIRMFDLRIGFLPDGNSIGFYHGPALLSHVATLEDILYGFYHYLRHYTSEVLVISIKVDNVLWQPANGDRMLQEHVYSLLTKGRGKQFWFQENANLGTISELRGKLIFLRRLDWSSLTPVSSFPHLGVALPPSLWIENSPYFSIDYSSPSNSRLASSDGDHNSGTLTSTHCESDKNTKRAYIEDYFEIGGPEGVDSKTSQKYEVTKLHLIRATEGAGHGSDHQEDLFITFASAEKNSEMPPVTPKIVALGNGQVPGVNYRLLPFLKERKGQRLGIILLDWYNDVPELVDLIISST